MKAIEWIKDHPYMTAGGVFAVGLVLILLLSGGEESEEIVEPSLGGYTPYASENAAANAALVQNQLAAQVAAKQSDNALAAVTAETEASYKLGVKQFEYLNNAAIISKDVAVAGYNADTTKALYAKETTLGVAKYQLDGAIAGYNAQQAIASMAAQTEQFRVKSETAAAMQISRDKVWESTSLAVIKRDLDYAKANLDYSARIAGK